MARVTMLPGTPGLPFGTGKGTVHYRVDDNTRPERLQSVIRNLSDAEIEVRISKLMKEYSKLKPLMDKIKDESSQYFSERVRRLQERARAERVRRDHEEAERRRKDMQIAQEKAEAMRLEEARRIVREAEQKKPVVKTEAGAYVGRRFKVE